MPPQGSARSTKTLATRYAPFLAIVALQLVLVTITPKNSTLVLVGDFDPDLIKRHIAYNTAQFTINKAVASVTPNAAMLMIVPLMI